MANQVTRLAMVRWLLDNGFREVPGKVADERKFEPIVDRGSKTKAIYIEMHGSKDLSRNYLTKIMRQLDEMGFCRSRVKAELSKRK